MCCFFFQAEDGIRDLVRSRGLGDVYKRQVHAGDPGARDRGAGCGRPGTPRGPGILSVTEQGLSLIHI